MNGYSPNYFNRKTVDSMKIVLAQVLSENTKKKTQDIQPNPKDPSTFAPQQGNPFEPPLGYDESGDFFRKGYKAATAKDPKTGRPAQQMSTGETEASYAERTYTGGKRKLEAELRNYGSKSEKGKQAAAALARLETSYAAYKAPKKEQIQTLQGASTQQGLNLSGTNTYSDPNVSIRTTPTLGSSPFSQQSATPSIYNASKEGMGSDFSLPASFAPSSKNFPLRSPLTPQPGTNPMGSLNQTLQNTGAINPQFVPSSMKNQQMLSPEEERKQFQKSLDSMSQMSWSDEYNDLKDYLGIRKKK